MPDSRCKKVEGGALGGQQSTRRAADLGHQLAGDHFLAVGGVGDELECRLHAVEQGLGHGQPGQHARLFGHDAALEHQVCGQSCLAGGVAGANVLGDGQFDERLGGLDAIRLLRVSSISGFPFYVLASPRFQASTRGMGRVKVVAILCGCPHDHG